MIDKSLRNRPCYDKEGNEIGWLSRSIASVIAVFAKNKNGEWCILASERGEEAADFQGCWNMPCGYLDYNETTKDAAIRECFEETGVKLDEKDVRFFWYQDDPEKSNRQNVTFRFYAILNKKCEEISFSRENNEGKEVGEIKFVNLKEIDDYKWAFGHETLIKEVADKTVKMPFWKKICSFKEYLLSV